MLPRASGGGPREFWNLHGPGAPRGGADARLRRSARRAEEHGGNVQQGDQCGEREEQVSDGRDEVHEVAARNGYRHNILYFIIMATYII